MALENEEFLKWESGFAQQHRYDTDEELLKYLRDSMNKFGHVSKMRKDTYTSKVSVVLGHVCLKRPG